MNHRRPRLLPLLLLLVALAIGTAGMLSSPPVGYSGDAPGTPAERGAPADRGTSLYRGSPADRRTPDGFRQLSDAAHEARRPRISGDRVVWMEHDGHDWEIVLRDEYGRLHQLTDNAYDDVDPAISGNRVVWAGYDGHDFEIFLWEDGQVRQLTDNEHDDMEPAISGERVVWAAHDGDDFEIVLWENGHTRQLTQNAFDDREPQIAGPVVAWSGFDGHDWEVVLYASGTIRRLTDNNRDDRAPAVWGTRVVWQEFDGNDFEIYAWERDQLTQLSDNTIDDVAPRVDGQYVVWSSFHGADREIVLWDGRRPRRLTDNQVDDITPDVRGSTVVWAGEVDGRMQILSTDVPPGGGRLALTSYWATASASIALVALLSTGVWFVWRRARRRRSRHANAAVDRTDRTAVAERHAAPVVEPVIRTQTAPITQREGSAESSPLPTVDSSSPRSRPPRRWSLRVAALGAGLLAGIALAEAAVRWLPARWLPELSTSEVQQFYPGVFIRPSANPRLRYELVPDEALPPSSRSGEVNTDGYRGPRVLLEKPPGVRRIVAIGDSTFFGWKVPEAEGCLRRLEALLIEHGRGPVEVVNLAVPGYNTVQEIEVLRSRAAALAPDLLLVGYDHNDADAPGARLLSDTLGDNPLGSELVRYVRRKGHLLAERRRDRDSPHDMRTQWGYVFAGPAWDRHLESLAELAAECSRLEVPALVVIVEATLRRNAGQHDIDYQRLNAVLVPFLEGQKLHVLDTYHVLQQHLDSTGRDDARHLWLRSEPPFDWHPNPQGHELLAEAMFEAIVLGNLLD